MPRPLSKRHAPDYPSLLILTLSGATAACAAKHTLRHGKQIIVVDASFLLSDQREQAVLTWIITVSTALASVYGRWPRDQLRVEITPVGLRRRDPVPWAKVQRGQPDTVSFYIDALAIGNKGLGAVYHILVAIAYRSGFHPVHRELIILRLKV